MSEDDPLIVRAEMETPDIIIVQHPGGELTVIAHPSVPDDQVEKVASVAGPRAGVSAGVWLS